MKINILTLFPEMFQGILSNSIVKRAIEKGALEVEVINIRDYAYNKHRKVDDTPFGGNQGMVMMVEPLFEALEDVGGKVIYTSPQGKTYNQDMANELAMEKEITILAGHYEGIDERVVDRYIDIEISIGDYVLTGGEVPAMVMIDSIARLLPDVIRKESYVEDSFYDGLLDHPHYTRPAEYKDLKVPEVLLSGHHENIRKWRLKERLRRTALRRPDLLLKREYTKEEITLIKEIEEEEQVKILK